MYSSAKVICRMIYILINVEHVSDGLINEIISFSVNCVESSDLWHSRIGILNFSALNTVMNLELNPNHTIHKKSYFKYVYLLNQ